MYHISGESDICIHVVLIYRQLCWNVNGKSHDISMISMCVYPRALAPFFMACFGHMDLKRGWKIQNPRKKCRFLAGNISYEWWISQPATFELRGGNPGELAW